MASNTQEIVPTNEWQTVTKDHTIPAGCHVRLNLETGMKEIKLLDKNDKDTNTMVMASGSNTPTPTTQPIAEAPKVAEPMKNEKIYDPQSDIKKRTPKDWQGLLNWSLAYIDHTVPSEYKEMEPERKKWLMNALENLSVSEAKLMRDALVVICKDYLKCFEEGGLTDEEVSTKEEALEDLGDLVDSLDNAQDLIPLGGFPAVIGLLDAKYPSLQWRAADVLATCLQNNPVCQDYALDGGVLGKLMEMVEFSLDGTVEAKALYALSGLVRSHEKAFKGFLLGNGLSLLVKTLAAYQSKPKVATKAVFMLGQLIRSELVKADLVVETNAVAVATQALSTNDRYLREHSLGLLSAMTLAVSFKAAATKPGVELKKAVHMIQQQINAMQDKEGHEEEINYIVTILAAIGK